MRTRSIVRLGVLAILLGLSLPVVVLTSREPAWLVDVRLDLDSPDAVATYMLRRFSFRHDIDLYGVTERFVPPDQFFERGAGDCDDWAWFAAETLKGHGYRTWLVSVWRQAPDEAGNTGHMVAAYLGRDGFGYVSTEGHVDAHAASLAGLADRVTTDWESFSVWRYDGRRDAAGPFHGWRPALSVPNDRLAARRPAPRRRSLRWGEGLVRLARPVAATAVN